MDISILTCTVVALSGGISIGWLLSGYQHAQHRAKHLAEREEIVTALSTTRQLLIQNNYWRDEYELVRKELHNLREIKASLEADLREATTRLESTLMYTEDKIRLTISNEQRLSEQLERLVNRIFEQTNSQVDKQNKQSLCELLAPLRELLDCFRRQVQDSFSEEVRERHALAHEIHDFLQMNLKIFQETVKLTKVLKGNNKTLGNWGEVVLKRVLESSGLRECYEYETLVSLENDNHMRMQPDVIVRLPKGKDVVIDAKMSLVAYERYFNAEDDCTRESALLEHISSVRSHIRMLGRKDYHLLAGLRSLDYVLMFIPVEPAFLVAISKQPELINEALRNNIMLVSPTTLLVALRTIANLWRYENQSRNAQYIAERASKLYDKIRLFVDDISAIGLSLEHVQNNYRLAMKKLSSGRGNILSLIEIFRSLGVEIKREINQELVELVANLDVSPTSLKEEVMHKLSSSNGTDDIKY